MHPMKKRLYLFGAKAPVYLNEAQKYKKNIT
jgi:hypothetical protein